MAQLLEGLPSRPGAGVVLGGVEGRGGHLLENNAAYLMLLMDRLFAVFPRIISPGSKRSSLLMLLQGRNKV